MKQRMKEFEALTGFSRITVMIDSDKYRVHDMVPVPIGKKDQQHYFDISHDENQNNEDFYRIKIFSATLVEAKHPKLFTKWAKKETVTFAHTRVLNPDGRTSHHCIIVIPKHISCIRTLTNHLIDQDVFHEDLTPNAILEQVQANYFQNEQTIDCCNRKVVVQLTKGREVEVHTC